MGKRSGTLEDLEMTPAFWKNKTVLVTGHTGFKGSWLSLWLQLLEAKVVGFALAPVSPSLFSIAKVDAGMTSITGDIRNLDHLKAVFVEHKPDIIIHMAAQSLVRYSYENPVETYATNVMGTVNVLEAARQAKVGRVIVNVTSDKCYENKEQAWGYQESDSLGGYDPYSNSKACAELVTTAYRHSYGHSGLNIASARAGNVIGGGDWSKDRLIPDIIRSITKQEQILLRYPEALRPWQHVLDPLQGYLQLAEHLYQQTTSYAEAWNFGPEERDIKPVSWITDKILELWGSSLAWQVEAGVKPHETMCLKLDSAKAKAKLGWKPQWQLEQALTETVNWFQLYVSGENMHEKTINQIKKYMTA